jgi:L-2,4-diaminobutyrate transaminase
LIEHEELIPQAAARGEVLQQRLRAAFADHPMVGEVRGMALIGAVEFVSRRNPAVAFDPALKVAGRVVKAALRRGVIGRALPSADTIAFSPPFVISEAEIQQGVQAFREAADEVMHDLIREGVWHP